ncbi:biotin/lipoyl-binding protein [Tabrizicola sp. DMG-N-6]|uniref:Biotin/lipoyl-binding protein n=1 Tax=Szabonella alba TaxID=2804194 RepID=A0A8K0V825_9RHOB|nr:biotin/lipoyl-binding protein [Szabonella alba]
MGKVRTLEQFLMPALSPMMQEGTLAKWLVKEGDLFKPGDIIAEIETDKATMEYEATADGVVVSILVEEGTPGVKAGTPIVIVNSDMGAVAETRRRAKARDELQMKNVPHYGVF